MAKKPSITTISSGYASTTALNDNFEALKEAFDNTLSRDGSTPNTMGADLDMNGNDIVGAGSILVGGVDYLAQSLAYKNAAETAKTAAEAAKVAAELAYDNFDDRYLGAKISDPSTDNDGNALLDGALYFDTTLNVMKVYDSGNTVWKRTTPTTSEQANIDTVTGISSDVTTVAGVSTNVTTVADNITDVNSVATNMAEVLTADTNAATATTKAAEASASATAAANSATSASTSATTASNQAASAATSASNAATSESNASTSASNAASSATSASGSAATATTQASNAASSASAASTSSTQAAGSAIASASSASDSATSEANAATSESNAATSASNAATSATNAASSATNAATSAASAAASYDSFDDRYLGVKTSAPTTDNDGDALTTGCLYYNSTIGQLYIWDGSAWDDAALSASGAVTAFNTRTGSVTLNSTDILNASGLLTTGGTLTGDLSFGDNDKAIFGAGSDLEIYYDSASGDSIIAESGSGHLKLLGNDIRINNADSSKAYFKATNGGSAIVYYDNAPKLSTTSTGVDITGTLTSDGLTVDGNASLSGTSPHLTFYETDLADTNTRILTQTRKFRIGTVTDAGGSFTERFQIDHSTGDISFYEDTGTTAKFYWDASAERLGIGTSSPSAPLEVDGGSDIAFFDGTNVRLKIQNPSTGVLQLNSSGAGDSLSFATVDTERMRIDSSGNVGIGTLSPDTPLHIETSGNTGIKLKSSTTGTGYINFNDGVTAKGQLFYDHNGDYMRFYVNGAERMRIDSSGNVGIGSATPNAKLTLKRSGAGLLANGDDGTVVALIADTTGSVLTYGTYTSHPVTFKTANGERMRIDSSGNVGIGTTSTTLGRLTVIQDYATNADTLILKSPGASGGGSQSGIKFVRNTDATLAQIYADTNSGAFITNVAGSEAMRIDSSGNLLVGKTSTGFGTAGIELRADNTLWVTRNNNTPAYINRLTGDGNIVEFAKDGTTVGSIGVIASNNLYVHGDNIGLGIGDDNLYATNASGASNDNAVDLGDPSVRFKDGYFSGTVNAANFNTTSDATLKTNVETLTGSLDAVKALRGVSFDWIENGNSEVGVIAQEVEEVIPDVVSTNDQGIKSVKYGNLVGVLIEAIKEQQAQIDELKARIGD